LADKVDDLSIEVFTNVDIVPYLKYHAENNPNVLDVGAFAIAVFKNMKDFIKENYGEVIEDGSVPGRDS